MTLSTSRRRALVTLAMLGGLPDRLRAQADSLRPSAEPLRIVASFSLLADMAQQVGGSAVQVTALVGPDADAHVFTPTPLDVRRLAQADLVIVNGLGFEGWLDRLVRAAGYRGTVVAATAGITPRQGGRHADPHAWQSLVHAQRYVENIRAAIVQARPSTAPQVNARAAAYTRELAALDASIRTRLAAVPAEDRHVMTSHDAFGYFAEAYGLRFRSAQGWNTAGEASAGDVAKLVRLLKTQRVRALFVENINDPRLVERIAQETGARVGGTLYSDALSAPGTPAGTYLGMMKHNADSLLAALAPATAR